MNKWEYEVVSGETDWPQIHQLLGAMGEEGWELVSFGLNDDVQHNNGIFESNSTQILGGIYHMILKRPAGTNR